jgi:hypothetical protein
MVSDGMNCYLQLRKDPEKLAEREGFEPRKI